MEKSQSNTEELHPIETKILDAIDTFTEIPSTSLIEKTNLTIDQIRRGLQWLKFKNIIQYSKPSTLLTLDISGKSSVEHGLPERRLVIAINEGNTTITKILENKRLMQSEINIAISKARSNKWIELTNTENTGLTFKLTGKSKVESQEELLLKKIFLEKTVKEADLSNSELAILKVLIKTTEIY